MVELRKLSEHCEFDANLDDMLKDRLVSAMQDIKIQQKFLSETTLNLDKGFQIASAIERVPKDSLQIQNEPKENTSNKVYYEKSSEKRKVRESMRVSDVGEITIGKRSAMSKTPNILNVKELAIFQIYAHDLLRKR